jgi:hypothetical protein
MENDQLKDYLYLMQSELKDSIDNQLKVLSQASKGGILSDL